MTCLQQITQEVKILFFIAIYSNGINIFAVNLQSYIVFRVKLFLVVNV